MNNLIYSSVLILCFVFISDAYQNELQNEKRQFIAVPRVGRSTNDIANLNNLNQVKTNPSIPINKILNHIYSDLLKRQGYIPTPRVGRSLNKDFLNNNDNKQQIIDFYKCFLRLNSANAAADNNRFKRSAALDFEFADAFDNLNNNDNLITNNKRQFLPPPRIGKKSNFDLTKETVGNQLTSNSIDSSLDNLQAESNYLEPSEKLDYFLRWLNLNKNKQNAYSEKRAQFSSRLGRSAPLTPRLGRSFWQLDNTNDDQSNDQGNEHQDRQSMNYYETINNRNIRTALTPRIGKRSADKTAEKVI